MRWDLYLKKYKNCPYCEKPCRLEVIRKNSTKAHPHIQLLRYCEDMHKWVIYTHPECEICKSLTNEDPNVPWLSVKK